MESAIKAIHLGDTLVSMINVGDIESTMAEAMDPPPGGYPAPVAEAAAQRVRFSQNCIYTRIGTLSLVVDPSVNETKPGMAGAIPNYTPPADLLTALASLGVLPDAITHVVITHVHWDHINGLTISRNGTSVPAFPKARCYLGRADFYRAETQQSLADPASLESRTLAVLQRAGLLELSEGTVELGAGVQIIAAPGETPGHQMLRIQAGGKVLYCVGDLIHTALEIEYPQYMVRWAEPQSTLASRLAFIERALSEDALIVATHIGSVTRLRRDSTGVHLVAV
jgi:glyoxylase-like metal-dependent hydrolase (beta-lactamase superfamily II)